MRRLARRERRILIIGVCAAAVILVFFYGVLPFYDSQEKARAELESKSRLLRQTISTIQNQEVYAAQLRALEAELGIFRGQLLDAAEGTMARVQLEEIVRGVAEENGVTITRSNPLPERKIGEKYSKVTLQVNLQSGMSELTGFLVALANHPKFLQVDGLTVNGFRVKDQIRLQPRLNVSAYIRLLEG